MDGVITQAPRIIRAEAIGARILRVTWTPVGDASGNVPATGYRVTAVTSSSGSTVTQFTEEVSPDLTTFIFHGLSPYQYSGTPGVMYSVSVLAFNNNGDGPPSDQLTVLLPRKKLLFVLSIN